MFNKLNNDKVCKCLFCQNTARFISFLKGYGQTCSSEECMRKLFLKNNVELKNLHRQKYSEFVLNNLEFYKNVEFPLLPDAKLTIRIISPSKTSLTHFQKNRK